jgi:hypothetical protein
VVLLLLDEGCWCPKEWLDIHSMVELIISGMLLSYNEWPTMCWWPLELLEEEGEEEVEEEGTEEEVDTVSVLLFLPKRLSMSPRLSLGDEQQPAGPR